MSKPKLIIVEGAQGAGKSSIVQGLRDKLPYAQSITLRGNKFRDEQLSFNNHFSVLKLINETSKAHNDYILERSYISELCYSTLYSDGGFRPLSEVLTNYLKMLKDDYDITFVLMLSEEETFEERLVRDKGQFSDVIYESGNSMRQQDVYVSLVSSMAVHFNVVSKMNNGSKHIHTIVNEILSVV